MTALDTSTITRIACADFGATNGTVQVLNANTAQPIGDSVSLSASSRPNRFETDWRTIIRGLDQLWQRTGGFHAISFGFAGRIKGGCVMGAGSLDDWAGRHLKDLLEQTYDVPVLVDNDGAMIAADALQFGVLSSPEYRDKSGLLIAIGTGIAVCTWFADESSRMHIHPGEGAHMTVNMYGNGRRSVAKLATCGCGQANCVDSLASGRLLKAFAAAAGMAVQDLPDEEVYSLLGDTVGTMIANILNLHPKIEVVLTSGGVVRNRPGLTDVLYDITAQRLQGYVEMPVFVESRNPSDGVRGALAYWLLRHGVPAA